MKEREQRAMQTREACVYVGQVVHRRHAPKTHKLRYRIFSFLIDPENMQAMQAASRFFSHNRFNLYSFHDGDHGDGSLTPLRTQIDRLLGHAGVGIEGGHIRLLCMPRVLGYAFNPLCVFYCYDAEGHLAALVYEVNNTFGQRHTYVIPTEVCAGSGGSSRRHGDIVEQYCYKRFHVSPFLDMNMQYGFRILPPEERLSLTINVRQIETRERTNETDKETKSAMQGMPGTQGTRPMLDASYGAKRAVFNDATLLRLFVTHPLLTLKVIGGIHWEALQVWLKGAGYHPCPPAPPPFTVVSTDGRVRELAGTAGTPHHSSTHSPSKVS